MLRIVFAGAAVALAFAAAAQASNDGARCQEANFRVYFSEGAATLDDAARETLAAAQRNVADCTYAELHVAVDTASPQAARRGQAVLAATDSDMWDVRAVEAMPMTRRVSMAPSPDYAQVLMTPRVVPVGERVRDAEAGV
jgi:hypothetical protein